jgi:hypothetical protein
MQNQNKYNKFKKLDVNNQPDQTPDDPFAFLDEKPEVHTPESIRERCKQLVKDAEDVIPALRIVGMADMKNPWGYQLAENELCNQMLSLLSSHCGHGATDKFFQGFKGDLCPDCADEELPTMDELDIPEPGGDDDEEDR